MSHSTSLSILPSSDLKFILVLILNIGSTKNNMAKYDAKPQHWPDDVKFHSCFKTTLS